MSDDANQPREVVLLPDAAVLKIKVTVQCGTQLAEPSPEHPDGLFCLNIIESADETISWEPGIAAELGVECPSCSKRISEHAGAPLRAVIPIALLVGQQVEDSLAAEGEEEDADEDDAGDEDEEPQGVVELTPDDQQ